MSDIKKEISTILNKSKSAPILFIGSGLSRRYLDTDDWAGLFQNFCTNLKLEYKKYYGKANGSLPKVAQYLAEDFYDMWWDDPEYRGNREKYSGLIKSKKSPLKIEIANYLKTKTNNNKHKNEIELLKQIKENGCIDSIITTNWDTFLEDEIFKGYDVKVGQDDLLISELVGLEEIYKIHGSITNPESLVLDYEDYEGFNSKNAYLSAKLLTLFVEHPIIFLGYSLSDENIQAIIKSISKCLNKSYQKRLENNLIFIQPIFNDDNDSITNDIFTIEDISIPRTIINLKDYSKVYEAILDYTRKFPFKLIKQMKESIYEIIIDNNPKNKIIVSDIQNCDNIDGADFVVGIGLKQKLESVGVNFNGKALHGIGYDDLLIDIIEDNIIKLTDVEKAKKITDEVIRKSNFPMFKYIKISKKEKFNETIEKKKNKSFEDIFVSENKTYKSYRDKANKYNSSTDIINDKKLVNAMKIKLLSHLNEEKFNDLGYLKQYLSNNLDIIKKSDKGNTNEKSEIRKLIKIYDFLMYSKI